MTDAEHRNCPVCGLKHPYERALTECVSALRQRNEWLKLTLRELLDCEDAYLDEGKPERYDHTRWEEAVNTAEYLLEGKS